MLKGGKTIYILHIDCISIGIFDDELMMMMN